MKYYYDLHIHSALSPCADDDMTPNNIINMCRLKGLDIIAVADHNSDLNARAAACLAESAGLLLIPAIELTTAEDIHLLCFFESFENSGEFFKITEKNMLKIENKPEIFGRQIIYGQNDEVLGEYKNLLTVSSGMSIEAATIEVMRLGGVAIPAHIDRQYNSIISVLGEFDYTLGFRVVESKKKILDSLPYITNSDAHSLGLIGERENYLELDNLTIKAVLSALKEN